MCGAATLPPLNLFTINTKKEIMPYYNHIELIGNTGKDAEIKATNSGKKKFSVTVATAKSYKDNSGNWVSNTTWHNVIMWGPAVDRLENLKIKKGEAVFCSGELLQREWQDNNGQKQRILEINADKFFPLRNKDGNGSNQNQYQQSQKGTEVIYPDGSTGYMSDDDLPF